MVYIGIDSGTQSTKSIVVDAETGEILASAQQKYDLIPNLPPGHMEQDPQDWIDATDATIQECIQKIGKRAEEIEAIGVSGQQHGLVVLNASNEVIRAAKLWCDTSTSEQCQEIIDEFQNGLAPTPSSNVHQSRPGSVSILHPLFAGQPEIDVIVRQ